MNTQDYDEPSFEDIQYRIDVKRKLAGIEVDPKNYCLGQKIYQEVIRQYAKRRKIPLENIKGNSKML